MAQPSPRMTALPSLLQWIAAPMRGMYAQSAPGLVQYLVTSYGPVAALWLTPQSFLAATCWWLASTIWRLLILPEEYIYWTASALRSAAPLMTTATSAVEVPFILTRSAATLSIGLYLKIST